MLTVALTLVLAFALLALGGCNGESHMPDLSVGSESDNAHGASRNQAENASTKTITDMVGRTLDVPLNATRIVGYGSVPLRTISYLGATDLVVGVEMAEQEDYVACGYRHVNVDTFKQLPVIGEGGSKGVTPNEEALALVAPQIVFASIDKDAADSLQDKTGIPVVCIVQNDKIFDDQYYDAIKLIGGLINKEDRANELVKYLQDTQKDLAGRAAAASGSGTKTAYAAGISFRGGHGFAGTEAQFPPFVETKVINIADVSGQAGAFDIDIEQILAAQPEYIFVETSNLSLVKDDYINNPAYFSSLNAVATGNTFSLVSYRFYGANIELAIANCYQVGAVVYPDAFSDIDPTKKLDQISTFFLGKPLSADLAAEGYEFKQLEFAAL
jgi:iron complex transport system substrate-binding protein